MNVFDVIVIGTGAGAKLIRPIANRGLTVAAIESGKAGGTCLNHGCIPSKMLIHPADTIREVEEGRRINLLGAAPEVDFAALVSRTTSTVDHDCQAIVTGYKNHPNITYFEGTATFTGPQSIAINGHTISAKQIFIAAGVRPRIPDIAGLAGTPYLTHKDALRMTKKPRSITILGGGFIALELGHFFASAGVRTVIVSRSGLVKELDSDVRDQFIERFTDHVTVHENSQIHSVAYENSLFTTHFQVGNKPASVTTDQLLVATGMIPNSDILNVDAAHIATTDDGYITVDNRLKTSNPTVWAFGDIIGMPFFRHKANFDGEYLWRSLFEAPSDAPIAYPPIPWAIFSYPQVAGFGPTESELTAAGVDFVVGKCPYIDSGMGMAYRSDYGFIKLIFDRATRRLLSSVAIGPQAATMMHMPIAYHHMNATLSDMLATIYIHPALPELVRNAARRANAAFEALR